MALQIRELRFDLSIRGVQAISRCHLEENLVVDHLSEQLEFQGLSLFGSWKLLRTVDPSLIGFLEIGCSYFLSVYAGHDIVGDGGMGAAPRKQET